MDDEAPASVITFVPAFATLTPEEQLAYLKIVGERLLAHRYRYYVQDSPALADFEYDYLERYYEALAAHLGQPNTFSNMVGFDWQTPGAKEIAERVESSTDDYGLWLARMQPIWDKIGMPRYKLTAEDKADPLDAKAAGTA